MKKSLVVLLIVALVFLGCATTGKAAQEEDGRFYEKTGGFSIMIPDAWEAYEMPGLKYKILIGPEENDSRPNINFVDEASGDALNVYVDGIIAQLQELFNEDIEIVQRDDFVTSKKLKGEKVAVNTVQFGQHLRQTFYCFPGKGTKIMITCTVQAEAGEAFADMFDRTLKTFEWIK